MTHGERSAYCGANSKVSRRGFAPVNEIRNSHFRVFKEILDIARAVKYPDDLDTVFERPVKDQMLGELLQRKHSHARKELGPVPSDPAQLGLAGKEAEGFFGGAIEPEAGFQVLTIGQIFGLVVKIAIRSRPDKDAACQRVILAGLCLTRSALRLCSQKSAFVSTGGPELRPSKRDDSSFSWARRFRSSRISSRRNSLGVL